jgi:hypothetical protein
MDSFDLYGVGAKWCIGYDSDNKYWTQYVVKNGDSFLFVYDAINKQKWMLQYNRSTAKNAWEVWDAADSSVHIGNIDDCLEYCIDDKNKLAYIFDSIDMSPNYFESEIKDLFESIVENEGEWALERMFERLNDEVYAPAAEFQITFEQATDRIMDICEDDSGLLDFVTETENFMERQIEHIKAFYIKYGELNDVVETHLLDLCSREVYSGIGCFADAEKIHPELIGEIYSNYKKQISSWQIEQEKAQGQQFLKFDESYRNRFNLTKLV